MSMMNTGDILETIEMFTQDNLDAVSYTHLRRQAPPGMQEVRVRFLHRCYS